MHSLPFPILSDRVELALPIDHSSFRAIWFAMAPDTLVQAMPSLPTRPYLSRPRVQPAPVPPIRTKYFVQERAPPEEEDIFLSGLNKPQRKPAPSATVRVNVQYGKKFIL